MRVKEIAAGVFYLPLRIANVYFVGERGGTWALVDTGMPGDGSKIREAAESVYGIGVPPSAIYLTHGHTDHSGSALELASLWGVQIFAHALEIPYLTGKSGYPPLDSTVGGFLGLLNRFFQPALVDLQNSVRTLPSGSGAGGLAGWEWVHTPGHSPGHVAFFRKQDWTLLAGDAVTTMNLDSFLATVSKMKRVCGPPSSSTYDWTQAAESVRKLAELRPVTLACGHGTPMSGGDAVMQLGELASHLPLPQRGRYTSTPAVTDENGIVSLPPKPEDPVPGAALGLGIIATGALVALAAWHRKKKATGAATADTPAQAS